MRDYDETTLKLAEVIIKRGDEIIRQRKIKVRQRITFAASGVCAASVLCFCILNINQSLKLNNGNDDNNPAVTSNTTTEDNSTAESTTITTEPVNDTTTVSTETVSDTSIAETEATSETSAVLNIPVTVTETETKSDNEEPHAENQPPENPGNTAEPDIPVNVTEKAEIIATEPPATTVVTTILQPTLCGDVNGDGIIDIEDVSIIRNYIYDNAGSSWAEYYAKVRDTKISADQALANADTFRPSYKREITSEDLEAILGYINGDIPQLPVDKL